MLNRRSNISVASGSVGIKGISISSTFDGRCVTTIVLTRPMRLASRDATNAENPAKTFAAKNTAPSVFGSTPNRR
jgi:hypothetical protein